MFLKEEKLEFAQTKNWNILHTVIFVL